MKDILVVALNATDAYAEAREILAEPNTALPFASSEYVIEKGEGGSKKQYRIVPIELLEFGLRFGLQYAEVQVTPSFAAESSADQWRTFRVAQSKSWPRAGGVPA